VEYSWRAEQRCTVHRAPAGGTGSPVAHDSDELLAKLTMPVLFLWGEGDPNGGAAVAGGSSPRLPNAELVMVPGAEHAPWVEFPMSSLKNDAERLVVQRLCDRLTDSWLVSPAVGLSDHDRDREIDVVVSHERDGIAVVEGAGGVHNALPVAADRSERQPRELSPTA